MKEIHIYSNPEKTITLSLVGKNDADMFGYKLPQKTLEVKIENSLLKLSLTEVKYIKD